MVICMALCTVIEKDASLAFSDDSIQCPSDKTADDDGQVC